LTRSRFVKAYFGASQTSRHCCFSGTPPAARARHPLFASVSLKTRGVPLFFADYTILGLVGLGRGILVTGIDNKQRRLRGQRGEGKFKAIAITAIIVFLGYSAFKLLPPYIAEYQLADKMQEQARFAVVNRYTEEQIRETIFKEAQDLDVPIKKEEIKVLASSSVVRISLDYTVPVDLLVYKMELHFTPSSENKSIL
jgi:hypothetical protein